MRPDPRSESVNHVPLTELVGRTIHHVDDKLYSHGLVFTLDGNEKVVLTTGPNEAYLFHADKHGNLVKAREA